MKSITSSLTALFATREFDMCGLYQFDLAQGGTLYYASADVNIYLSSSASGGNTYWNNQTFNAASALFDDENNRSKMEQKIGTQASTLNFDVKPGSATVQGAGFLSAVLNGVFDGAVLTYSGAYWPYSSSGYVNPIIPTGTINKFVGRVAEVSFSRNAVSFTINSHLELLNIQMPRNLYQSGCLNTLFDAGCTLNSSSFVTSSAAATSSTSSTIKATLAASSGYYNLGRIVFTSGVLNGVARTIQNHTSGSPATIQVVPPFPSSPSSGDTFNIYPGCDKSSTTCSNKFNNLIHFRGTPFIPVPDTAI